MQQWKRTSTAKKWLTDYKNELETASDVENLKLSGPWQHQWHQFCNSLVELGSDDNARIWATQDPSSFFSVSGIQSGVGLNLRAISSFPATLTGLGITFTFAGLVIGVTAAGNNLERVMASEDPNLLGMIEPLLSGAGVAFVTSLVGLGLSILYSNLSNLFTRGVQTLVGEWNQELRAKWPVVSQSFVLADSQQQQATLLEELIDLTDSGQSAQVELLSEMRRSIADDLASAMIRALDQIRADRRQSDNTMVEEFSRCLNNMSEEFNSSIKTMVQQFHNTVRDMAGEEIDRFAGQLKELHSEYVSANELLVATNSKMLDQVMVHSSSSLEQVREININLAESTAVSAEYGERLYKQFAETQREIQRWVLDILEDSRSVIHSDLVAVGNSLKSNADEAGQILINGADMAGKQLSHSGVLITQELQAASESLKGSLQESGKSFNNRVIETGETIKSAGTQVSTDLAETSKVVTLLHADLHQKGVQLLQDLYEGAGYIFNDQVKEAGRELIAGSKQAVDNFAACGASVAVDLHKASESLKDGMSHFIESARQAGNVAASEMVQGAKAVSSQQQVMIERHEKAASELVFQIEIFAKNIETAGREALGEWSNQVNEAGRELIAGSKQAVDNFTACAASVADELDKASESLKDGMSHFVESARQAGHAAASEMVQGAKAVSNQQQVMIDRHEKAATELVSQIETSAKNIETAGKEALGGWSIKVADASSALVMAANESARVAKVIEPILDAQSDIAGVLSHRAQELVNASRKSQEAQDQVLSGLLQVVETTQQHASFVSEISESKVKLEDQLINLTEQFVAQHREFSERIEEQRKQQKEQWNKLEKDLISLSAGQRKHFNELDSGIAGAVSDVNSGLQEFANEITKFVTDLDKHSKEILQTLSNSLRLSGFLMKIRPQMNCAHWQL